MARKQAYIVTRAFKSPNVIETGISHRPAEIAWKKFSKGQIIKGELKHSNGKPAFVLIGRMTVVPLGNIKRLVTKTLIDRSSGADGTVKNKATDYMKKTAPKIKYMDGILVGAGIGGVGFWLAEKKNLIQSNNPKNKFYAAAAGSALAWYLIYRYHNRKNKPKLK